MTKEEFSRIIDRYLAGEATLAERNLVDDFFNAQEPKKLLENATLSDEMWRAVEARLHKAGSPAVNVRRRNKRAYVVVSTVIVLLLSAGLFYYYQRQADNVSPTMITRASAYGQKLIVTLTDSSKVYLNSGSSISYPPVFAPGVREVVLNGEAFFEVKRDTSRPFIVRSGNVTTKVLGTSFNVQAFAGQPISVTVATGKVQVEALHPSKESDDKVVEERVILRPLEQATLHDDGLITTEVDTAKFLAWKNNILRFDDASIADVAHELERWYNIQIAIENDRILNCRINGQFKDQSLVSVLKSIHYMYNIDFKYTNQTQIILYGKGCTK